MTAGVFLSYSTRDRERLENLLSALRRADEQVWFDDELGGGEVWWQQILESIRGCDVFLFALSDNALQSKPCLAELQYAQALNKPIVPIQIGPVGSMRITPLATVEAVDFQNPTVDSGIRLITAVQWARERSVALPSPLPEEPPVPFAYLMRLAAAIAEADLDATRQAEIVAELKTVIAQDGGDTTTRNDITQLLRSLHSRADATQETRAEAANLLAALTTTSEPAAQHSPIPTRGSRRWVAVATAAVAVIAAAVVAGLVFTRQPPAPVATPESAPAGDPVSTSPGPAPLPAAKLGSILLTPQEAGAIMGTTGLQADPINDGLSDQVTTPSDPDCAGAGDAAVAPVYTDSGWISAKNQTLSQSSPDDPDVKMFWVDQAVVDFPTARQATDFLNRSANRWTGCAGRVINETSDGGAVAWTYGDLARAGNTLSVALLQEGGDGWGCQHTLAAHSTAIIEAVACSNDFTDQAARVVAAIVEKAKV